MRVTRVSIGVAVAAVTVGLLGLVGALPSASAGTGAGANDVAVEIPGTAPGRCARAFIEMWNAGSVEAGVAFEREFASAKRLGAMGAEGRAERFVEMHERHGTIAPVRVVAEGEHSITLLFESADDEMLQMEFRMSAKEPGRLDVVAILMGPGIGRVIEVTPTARAETVRGVAEAVEEGYVYPEVGVRMAESLRANLASGAYDGIEDGRALAMRLTEDLRAISHDRHLGVRIAPPPMEGAAEIRMAPSGANNFAFKKVERLDGNIGYVRFDGFVPGPEAERTAAAALAFVAHCDALIFDLRSNGGGHPEMIRFITSYLFDEPTHLNDMVDREGDVIEEYWTLEEIPGERFDEDLPVYVLTSGYTFSGAEEFSYNLKNLGRATIVGETTGGGAHPVRGVRINDHFMVGVPYMRARNPISGTNWEGTGVEPDVSVPADEALDRAIELARGAIEGE